MRRANKESKDFSLLSLLLGAVARDENVVRPSYDGQTVMGKGIVAQAEMCLLVNKKHEYDGQTVSFLLL